MKWNVPEIAEVFESVDWIVPAYVQIGVIRKLAASIDAAPAAQKQAVLEAELSRLYPPEDIAVMLLERYSKTVHVADFKHAIAEAVEAAHLGLFNAAVTALVPVIEGILRKVAAARGQPMGMGTQDLISEIQDLAKRERTTAAPASCQTEAERTTFALACAERADMLQAFGRFLKDRVLVNTSKYTGAGELNRHGILHGVFHNHGHPTNFYKLISFLDLVCFILAFRTPMMSILAPATTPESRRLADYYRALTAIRAAAVAAGARL